MSAPPALTSAAQHRVRSHMKSHWLTLLCALALSACGPSDREVVVAFEREHPGARVVSAAAGEGDSDSVYYHIKYRLAGDANPREGVWLYSKQPDGTWAVRQRMPSK
jgi:hypothetical protein